MKKVFKIPVKYTVLDYVDGFGENLEEAIRDVKRNIDTVPIGYDPTPYDDCVMIEDGEDGNASIEEAAAYINYHYNQHNKLEIE